MSERVALSLDCGCIKTAAEMEYEKLMERFFSEDDTEGRIDRQIELIRQFLEDSNSVDIENTAVVPVREMAGTVFLERSADGSCRVSYE